MCVSRHFSALPVRYLLRSSLQEGYLVLYQRTRLPSRLTREKEQETSSVPVRTRPNSTLLCLLCEKTIEFDRRHEEFVIFRTCTVRRLQEDSKSRTEMSNVIQDGLNLSHLSICSRGDGGEGVPNPCIHEAPQWNYSHAAKPYLSRPAAVFASGCSTTPWGPASR